MLERAGYRPATWQAQWEQALKPLAPDLASIAEALKVWCQFNIPGWELRQLEPGAAQWLSKCLSLLVSVNSEPEARQWLAGCQRVMAEVMGVQA
jgi:hypothetical protein